MTVDEVLKALAPLDSQLKVTVNGYEVTKIESDTFYDSETGEEYDTLDIFTAEVKPDRLKCPFRKRTRTKSNMAASPMGNYETIEEFEDCYKKGCPYYETIFCEEGEFRCRKVAIEGSKAK
jgi:hypothetical protein